MSRIGLKPIIVPNGVTVTIEESKVIVKGTKGTLEQLINPNIVIKQEENVINITRKNELSESRQMHGTTRALLANMIIGVSEGFEKKLELVGVGYRAKANGKGITLSLGYSHPIEIEPIDGIEFKIEKNNLVTVLGIRKELVGQVAANIKAHRPPEPYLGKGVRYEGEKIRRKEGKKA